VVDMAFCVVARALLTGPNLYNILVPKYEQLLLNSFKHYYAFVQVLWVVARVLLGHYWLFPGGCYDIVGSCLGVAAM